MQSFDGTLLCEIVSTECTNAKLLPFSILTLPATHCLVQALPRAAAAAAMGAPYWTKKKDCSNGQPYSLMCTDNSHWKIHIGNTWATQVMYLRDVFPIIHTYKIKKKNSVLQKQPCSSSQHAYLWQFVLYSCYERRGHGPVWPWHESKAVVVLTYSWWSCAPDPSPVRKFPDRERCRLAVDWLCLH